jgi:multidrug efflux pump subunit AcrA (membrane-fusion protein)
MHAKTMGAVFLISAAVISILYADSNDARAAEKPQWKRYEVVANDTARLQFRGRIQAGRKTVIGNLQGLALKSVFVKDGAAVAAGEKLVEWDVSNFVFQREYLQKELKLTRSLLEAYIKIEVPRRLMTYQEKLNEIEDQINKARSRLTLEKSLIEKSTGSRARVAEAEGHLQRLIKLKNTLQNLLNAGEMETYHGEAGRYRLRILELERTIAEVDSKIGEATVTAPRAGVVKALQPLRPGPVSSGELLEIFELASLRVVGKVWQNEFLSLGVGQRVRIYPDFADQKEIAGRIAAKIPYGELYQETAIGEEMSRFKVIVDFEEPPESLLNGMSVIVMVEPRSDGIQVPAPFVFKDAKGVYVLKNRKGAEPERKYIRIAPGPEGYVNATGLKTGDILLMPADGESDDAH